MASNNRTHIVNDRAKDEDTTTPKFLTKEEFGRRLYRMMIAKGWRQSDLARAADMPRYSISTYIRGQSFPTAQSVKKLAEALGVEPERVLPNINHGAIREDAPSFAIKSSPGNPERAWLTVDREVSFDVAAKIAGLLNTDASN
ncbi:helix-turn-helix domain-containing protein [Hoeflea sp. G2-23]|uniref:Helix-turn-helix domain-containing protein n=1 Tax=Hoeflea algicola TaxID=2983763 RepID=A0ABT3Z9J2_9HYPH|nr:helix-turn-helix transcriptional regulator [Hoeflea algicola]MCY0148351.1 helix-turn-helix domain-containing protein [Hoeflea algicola]